ncbi:MAG: hypothetical protein HUU21_11910, partial [Polyangiaceae bacterium]|nr:hypothetical protein [Polyangiaceae bacterium]
QIVYMRLAAGGIEPPQRVEGVLSRIVAGQRVIGEQHLVEEEAVGLVEAGFEPGAAGRLAGGDDAEQGFQNAARAEALEDLEFGEFGGDHEPRGGVFKQGVDEDDLVGVERDGCLPGRGGGGAGGGSADNGVQATETVSGGTLTKSPNYRMISTFGQPTQNQGKTTSPSYNMQGGLIGAAAGK